MSLPQYAICPVHKAPGRPSARFVPLGPVYSFTELVPGTCVHVVVCDYDGVVLDTSAHRVSMTLEAWEQEQRESKEL